jgi:glycosyltransferase involved in cell wall biosynthesis
LPQPHVLVNGLCVPPGGVFTVTRELLCTLAAQQPDWRFTLVLSKGKAVHQEFKEAPFGPNVSLFWAPKATANRAFRAVYENTSLASWAKANDVSAALQMNGMVIPALDVPTFSYAGDPWPYRDDLWINNPRERILAFLKRREHARGMRHAEFSGWMSAYVRDLVCNYIGFSPARSEVLHPGMPHDYLERASKSLPSWSDREMEILTVSYVVPYKRQSLVIEALAILSRRPGFEAVRYRIVGECSPHYQRQLEKLAHDLGVKDRVIFEGRVPQKRVEECIRSARVFAFMSICECFGLPPIEAMTFGTPSVIADCCSAREIYGDAGEFCPPDDLPALVEALAHVMTDSARAEELRRLGAARVQSFSWKRTAARIGVRLAELMRLPADTRAAFNSADAPRSAALAE